MLVLCLMVFVTFQDIFRLVHGSGSDRIREEAGDDGSIAYWPWHARSRPMGVLGDRLIVDGIDTA